MEVDERDSEAEEQRPIKLDPGSSFLVAEIGSVTSSVALFDVVDGVYRLISRGSALTTSGPPWYDARHGLHEAIGQITRATGRLLLNENGEPLRPRRPGGEGVDYFGLITSVAFPLRTLLIGLLDEVSVASARAALTGVYAKEVDCFYLGDRRSRSQQLQAFLENQFDLAFVVGGTDGGADKRLIREVETLAIGLELLVEAERPAVLYAGNAVLRPKIKEILAPLTRLYLADNVRPTHEHQYIEDATALLGQVYIEEHVRTVPGMEAIFSWCNLRPKPVAHSLGAMAEYLSEAKKGRVLAVDVGSESVTFIAANPGKVDLFISPNAGTGRASSGLLEADIDPRALDMLSTTSSATEIRGYLMNRAVRPYTIPITKEAIELEQFLVRQAINLTIKGNSHYLLTDHERLAREMKLMILCGGALSRTLSPGSALLSALDTFQPVGIFPVYRDRFATLGPLGLLTQSMPRLVVEALEFGALEPLGWIIAPFGLLRSGKAVLKVRIHSETGQEPDVEVKGGDIKVLPLERGQTLELTIQPSATVDIGAGRGTSRRLTAAGGRLGVVIDARGRPITFPEGSDERRVLYQRWLLSVSG